MLSSLSAVGAVLWLTVGGIEAFMAYTFNDTNVPLAQMNARLLVMMSPLVLFVATVTLSILALAKFTRAKLVGALVAFGLAVILIISVPWARSPIAFVFALIRQAT